MDHIEKILDFAIRQEEAEANFYQGMAKRAESADLRRMLLEHAEQERDHKNKLEAILASHRIPGGNRRFANPDLRIADYAVADSIGTGELNYQDALILAAKREQAAERLYRDLAQQAADAETAALFTFLAEQESKHRHQIEVDYDDDILKEG